MNIFGVIILVAVSAIFVAFCGVYVYGYKKQKKLLKRARRLKEFIYEEEKNPNSMFYNQNLKNKQNMRKTNQINKQNKINNQFFIESDRDK